MLDSDLGKDIVNKMKINENRVYRNGIKINSHSIENNVLFCSPDKNLCLHLENRLTIRINDRI